MRIESAENSEIYDMGYFFFGDPRPIDFVFESERVSAGSNLWVNIYGQPTQRHYDPEKIYGYRFHPYAADVIDKFEIRFQTYPFSNQRLPPGGITLIDRKKRMVYAFLPGGGYMDLAKAKGGKVAAKIKGFLPILLFNQPTYPPYEPATYLASSVSKKIAEERARRFIECRQDLSGFQAQYAYAQYLKRLDPRNFLSTVIREELSSDHLLMESHGQEVPAYLRRIQQELAKPIVPILKDQE